MPVQPLIDFEALDLSTTILGSDDLYKVLKQRGRFELLGGVLHHDHDAGLIIGFAEVKSGTWWAEDHIPGRPLYPGALMIEAGAQLASYDFLTRLTDDPTQFVGFGGLNETRFRRSVEPDTRLILAAKSVRVRSRMFTYAVQGFVEGELAFQTEVLGVIV